MPFIGKKFAILGDNKYQNQHFLGYNFPLTLNFSHPLLLFGKILTYGWWPIKNLMGAASWFFEMTQIVANPTGTGCLKRCLRRWVILIEIEIWVFWLIEMLLFNPFICKSENEQNCVDMFCCLSLINNLSTTFIGAMYFGYSFTPLKLFLFSLAQINVLKMLFF